MTCTLLDPILSTGTWRHHRCWSLKAQGWKKGRGLGARRMLLGWAGFGRLWREPLGVVGGYVQRWVMGNPLALALRLVLGAQSPGTVLMSPLGPAGGFQGPVFGQENL